MKDKAADKWISIQSVAETLGCTDKYVYALIQQGDLRAMKLGERALRVSEQSLHDFVNLRIVNPEDYFAPQESKPEPSPIKGAKVARSNWMNR
jgi:excisionase family DNA binding protein